MKQDKAASLTIFFPCYNDAGTIGSLIASADTVASEYTDDYEILGVDDGSTDNSRNLLDELKRRYQRLRTVYHGKNKGYGAALCSGFSHATKDLIFYTDGDGQYDVLELRKFIPIMQDGIDVVNGYKIFRHDPWHRIFIGTIYLRCMRLIFNLHVRDIDCDFRLIRRRVFEKIQLKNTSGVICLELVKKLELAGFHFAEYPVNHYFRIYGHSQFFKVGRLAKTAWQILRLWWQLRTDKDFLKSRMSSAESERSNPSLRVSRDFF